MPAQDGDLGTAREKRIAELAILGRDPRFLARVERALCRAEATGADCDYRDRDGRCWNAPKCWNAPTY